MCVRVCVCARCVLMSAHVHRVRRGRRDAWQQLVRLCLLVIRVWWIVWFFSFYVLLCCFFVHAHVSVGKSGPSRVWRDPGTEASLFAKVTVSGQHEILASLRQRAGATDAVQLSGIKRKSDAPTDVTTAASPSASGNSNGTGTGNGNGNSNGTGGSGNGGGGNGGGGSDGSSGNNDKRARAEAD